MPSPEVPAEVAAEAVPAALKETVTMVEAKLAKGEYGKIGGGIVTILLAVGAYVNSWATGITATTADTKAKVFEQAVKLDSIKESQAAMKESQTAANTESKSRFDGLERHVEKLDDRLLNVERRVTEPAK